MDPLRTKWSFRSAPAATAASRMVGPGVPVFFLEKLHQDFAGISQKMAACPGEEIDAGMACCAITADSSWWHSVISMSPLLMAMKYA